MKTLEREENHSDWDPWLRDWLTRHPVKEPPAHRRQDYTEEVMASVRAEQTLAPARRWVSFPRLALGSAAAAAGLAAVLFLSLWKNPSERMALTAAREEHLLVAVGEEPTLPGVDLQEGLRLVDEWTVEDTLQLETKIASLVDSADFLEQMEPGNPVSLPENGI